MQEKLFYKKLIKIIYRFSIYLQRFMVHYVQKQKRSFLRATSQAGMPACTFGDCSEVFD